MMMAATTGCPCPSTNANGASNSDDSQTNNAETLLSSNAKFQAISAIAVSQDGVINVADQGKFSVFGDRLKWMFMAILNVMVGGSVGIGNFWTVWYEITLVVIICIFVTLRISIYYYHADNLLCFQHNIFIQY